MTTIDDYYREINIVRNEGGSEMPAIVKTILLRIQADAKAPLIQSIEDVLAHLNKKLAMWGHPGGWDSIDGALKCIGVLMESITGSDEAKVLTKQLEDVLEAVNDYILKDSTPLVTADGIPPILCAYVREQSEKVEKVKEELSALDDLRAYWEKTAKKASDSSDYYQAQLVDAHALLGRVIHQASERWDKVNLTKYHPTDNLWGHKTVDNPSGKKDAD